MAVGVVRGVRGCAVAAGVGSLAVASDGWTTAGAAVSSRRAVVAVGVTGRASIGLDGLITVLFPSAVNPVVTVRGVRGVGIDGCAVEIGGAT